MTYVVSISGFQPGARFDNLPWTEVEVQESATENGVFALIDTQALTPVDTDPSSPIERSLTTTKATLPEGWYKLVFKDAAAHSETSTPVFSPGKGGGEGTSVAILLARITGEGTFDVSTAEALGWLDQRHRLLCSRSKCFRQRVGIGPTVAGQVTYVVPASVMEIHEVQVAAGASSGSGGVGVPYGAGRTTDIAQGALGYIWLGGLYRAVGGGIYTRDASGAGADLLALYPTPGEAGLAITLRAVCRPAPLTAAGVVVTPPEFDDALVAGAIATGLERVEGRADLAASGEAKFSSACQELLTQVNKRYRGSGAATIRIRGMNA